MDTTQDQNARLLGVTVRRYLGIREVDLTFDEDERLVPITGRNEQGKSSLIRAVWALLGQGEPLDRLAAHDGEGPIVLNGRLRHPEEGELVVERTLKPAKEGSAKARRGEWSQSLKITRVDGSAIKSPQRFLDGLIGGLAVDPLAWLAQAERGVPGRRKMVEQLVEALKLETPKFAREAAETYSVRIEGMHAGQAIDQVDGNVRDRRHTINQQASALADRLETPEYGGEELTDLEGMDPEDPKNLKHMAEQASAREARANEAAQTVEKLAGDRAVAAARIESAQEALATAQAAARRAETALQDGQSRAEELRSEADADPAAPYMDQLAQLSEVNDRIARANRARDMRRELAGLTSKSDAMTSLLEQLQRERKELLADVPALPETFGLGETGELEFDGHPFPDQASSEQRIMVAVACSAAANPLLPIVRIEDGNRLDSEHRALLEKYLKENKMLALVEVVDDSAREGIYIEDGAVAEDLREPF